ncbi:MAG: hypothetical protein ABIT16_03340 [Croceibacterium sp.]
MIEASARTRNRRATLARMFLVAAATLAMPGCGPENDTHVALAQPAASANLQPMSASPQSAPSATTIWRGPVRAAAGVQVQTWYLDANDLGEIEAAGFGTVRWGISWSEVEKSPGVYDWSQVDNFVGRLDQTGLRSLVILGFGNALYSGTVLLPPDPAARELSVPAPPESTEARAAYARFAAAAAARYAGKPIAWELWNEPDNAVFWPLVPNPAAYAELAFDACRAIRAANSSASVVGGAGAALPNAVSWQSGNIYASLVSNGAMTCLDAISGHGYRMGSDYSSPGPDTIAPDLQASLSYLYTGLSLPAQKSFKVTEWGYPTSLVDPDLQIAYVMRGTLTNLASNVVLTVWYEWRDSRPEDAGHEAHFGLNTINGGPKASSATMSALTWLGNANYEGPATTGRVDAPAAFVTSGNKTYAMVWIATSDLTKRYRLNADGVYIGDISYLPKPFTVKNKRVVLVAQP